MVTFSLCTVLKKFWDFFLLLLLFHEVPRNRLTPSWWESQRPRILIVQKVFATKKLESVSLAILSCNRAARQNGVMRTQFLVIWHLWHNFSKQKNVLFVYFSCHKLKVLVPACFFALNFAKKIFFSKIGSALNCITFFVCAFSLKQKNNFWFSRLRER